jgi:hypothetical protein
MGLIGGPAFNPSVKNTEQDAEMAELKAQVAQLTALITPNPEDDLD